MKHSFYDLCLDQEGIAGNMPLIGSLGWAGIGAAYDTGPQFGPFIKALEDVKNDPAISVLSVACISVDKPDLVQKNARFALDSGADMILVYGGNEEINRAASECWEVDIILHPEKGAGRDLPDQKSSGIDHITARFMAEKGIALGIDFSELLNSYGMGRSLIMGRMRQNIMLAGKYGTPIVLSSGASDKYGLRSPMDLYSVGIALGMDPGLAKKALTDYPALIIKKARDRKNPNVITAGLEVLSGGLEKNPGRKKASGWY